MRDAKGFTLVELLIVMAIGGIIIALLGSIFVWGYRNAARTSQTFDLSTSSYTVLRELTAGFPHADGRQPGLIGAYRVGYTKGAGQTTLVYNTGTEDADITYHFDMAAGTLTRAVDTESVVVLHHVTAFSVCRDNRVLHISLEQKDDRVPVSTISLETQVYPRNASATDFSGLDACP